MQPVPKAVYRSDVYDKHATTHGGIRTLVLLYRSQAELFLYFSNSNPNPNRNANPNK